MPTPAARPPALDRSSAAVLEAATQLLLEQPSLSLGELAAGIGIGRTTLHRMFPTRHALLSALAQDAVDHLAEVYAAAGFSTASPRARRGRSRGRAAEAAAVLASVEALVADLVPLGPRLMFLLRAPELADDTELAARVDALDEPLRAAVERAQHGGALDPALPAWWVVESLYALVYVAWEQVERGRLAARDAAPLVMRTWHIGVRPA